ncbi:serine/threonine-protein kinase STY13-like isoform X3 [Papaver somniferum]|uniref:serine/threonine-protein kinase STY13-like isoform X3 n=1 Tax=Papaver somniferum TaxID=3469 RepID=UPI000E6F6BE4|nr:serine/threonine-protein kinase STY13-like isoform X3 [Papaver somniferum]
MDMNLNGASSSRQSEIYIATEEWEIDLSKLRIKNVIANGTYGTVYKGVYDGQDVAVKVMDWGADGDARTAVNRASFEQEVAIWHKLDHPNVTKFIGASMGTSNLQIPSTNSDGQGSLPANACCVVVEYLQGTLKNYLMKYRHRKLPYKTVIQLALDLARGLSYLHSKQIAHRDVKTENMLLDTKRTVKIADFGVARVEAKNASEMTVLTGTLGYMAPELWYMPMGNLLLRYAISSSKLYRCLICIFPAAFTTRNTEMLSKCINKHHAKMLEWIPRKSTKHG